MSADPASTVDRIQTGIFGLDAALDGGLPVGSVTVIAGPPGAGKTILAQQVCFRNATPERRALYFNTLSEPTAKTLRYLQQFSFHDRAKLEDGSIEFVDLGVILRARGLEKASALLLEHMRRVKPAFVVVDSFKVFDDLARSAEELRKFSYEIAVQLMAWECTALLLGEYGPAEVETNPTFSIVDGLISLGLQPAGSEMHRSARVVKMRGTGHSTDVHGLVISATGLDVFAPRVTIRRAAAAPGAAPRIERRPTAIGHLDELLGGGIPAGSSVLVAGAAGTGKTVLLLEYLYRGAHELGEKGIYFTFEETPDRLRATARGFGWSLDDEIARGALEIVYIPETDIFVDQHMVLMRRRIEQFDARRVAVDSLSGFLFKVHDPLIVRDKAYQLATVIQNRGAVGLLSGSVPFGSDRLSRFGVEETVLDGVILLTAAPEGQERRRAIEVYKLRNAAHLNGRHGLAIGTRGLEITPRRGPVRGTGAGP